MNKNYYMHLMDGSPAYWDKKDKALYLISQYHKLEASDILVHSLSTIKKQQEIYTNKGNWKLGYLRIPAGYKS